MVEKRSRSFLWRCIPREIADIEHGLQHRKGSQRLLAHLHAVADNISGATKDSSMASIIPLVDPEDGAFDDEVARNVGRAFNAAVQVLRSTAQPAVVYASIAARIIAAAGRGECNHALAASRFDGTRRLYLAAAAPD